jgi:hypothetical protein
MEIWSIEGCLPNEPRIKTVPEPKNVKVVDVMQVLKVINGTEDVSLAEINKAILNLQQYDLLVVDE